VIRENFREYLEEIIRDGYTVRHDEHGSDPDLIDPGGNPIETPVSHRGCYIHSSDFLCLFDRLLAPASGKDVIRDTVSRK